MYLRIDYFFVPHRQLEAVHSVEIGNITWSDHAPFTMRYALSSTLNSRPIFWRLNESLLQTTVVMTDVTNELKQYFQTNDTEDCDPGILLEAHKTVIRGMLIKHGARIKREREQLLQLLHKIHTVESKHKQTSIAPLEIELLSLRKQAVDLLQYRAKAALQVCRKVLYESGNKCGKLLAKAVRSHRLNTYIPHIISSSGQKKTTPTQIAKEFRDYYSSLYNLPVRPPNATMINDYISAAQIPQISTATSIDLDDPITVEELRRAVGGMKPGKAPGSGGFTLQYYQSLLPLLAPHMVKMFNGLGEGALLPRDTLRAHISLIPKEGKDAAACGSYRPIYLLNVDLKLFTKILANRITQHMPDLVHLDQVGFVPAREARDNTTKVLNLIHVVSAPKTLRVFLSTDAEKAFDRVN